MDINVDLMPLLKLFEQATINKEYESYYPEIMSCLPLILFQMQRQTPNLVKPMFNAVTQKLILANQTAYIASMNYVLRDEEIILSLFNILAHKQDKKEYDEFLKLIKSCCSDSDVDFNSIVLKAAMSQNDQISLIALEILMTQTNMLNQNKDRLPIEPLLVKLLSGNEEEVQIALHLLNKTVDVDKYQIAMAIAECINKTNVYSTNTLTELINQFINLVEKTSKFIPISLTQINSMKSEAPIDKQARLFGYLVPNALNIIKYEISQITKDQTKFSEHELKRNSLYIEDIENVKIDKMATNKKEKICYDPVQLFEENTTLSQTQLNSIYYFAQCRLEQIQNAELSQINQFIKDCIQFVPGLDKEFLYDQLIEQIQNNQLASDGLLQQTTQVDSAQQLNLQIAVQIVFNQLKQYNLAAVNNFINLQQVKNGINQLDDLAEINILFNLLIKLNILPSESFLDKLLQINLPLQSIIYTVQNIINSMQQLLFKPITDMKNDDTEIRDLMQYTITIMMNKLCKYQKIYNSTKTQYAEKQQLGLSLISLYNFVKQVEKENDIVLEVDQRILAEAMIDIIVNGSQQYQLKAVKVLNDFTPSQEFIQIINQLISLIAIVNDKLQLKPVIELFIQLVQAYPNEVLDDVTNHKDRVEAITFMYKFASTIKPEIVQQIPQFMLFIIHSLLQVYKDTDDQSIKLIYNMLQQDDGKQNGQLINNALISFNYSQTPEHETLCIVQLLDKFVVCNQKLMINGINIDALTQFSENVQQKCNENNENSVFSTCNGFVCNLCIKVLQQAILETFDKQNQYNDYILNKLEYIFNLGIIDQNNCFCCTTDSQQIQFLYGCMLLDFNGIYGIDDEVQAINVKDKQQSIQKFYNTVITTLSFITQEKLQKVLDNEQTQPPAKINLFTDLLGKLILNAVLDTDTIKQLFDTSLAVIQRDELVYSLRHFSVKLIYSISNTVDNCINLFGNSVNEFWDMWQIMIDCLQNYNEQDTEQAVKALNNFINVVCLGNVYTIEKVFSQLTYVAECQEHQKVLETIRRLADSQQPLLQKQNSNQMSTLAFGQTKVQQAQQLATSYYTSLKKFADVFSVDNQLSYSMYQQQNEIEQQEEFDENENNVIQIPMQKAINCLTKYMQILYDNVLQGRINKQTFERQFSLTIHCMTFTSLHYIKNSNLEFFTHYLSLATNYIQTNQQVNLIKFEQFSTFISIILNELTQYVVTQELHIYDVSLFAKVIDYIANVFNITDWDATNIDYKKMNQTLKTIRETQGVNGNYNNNLPQQKSVKEIAQQDIFEILKLFTAVGDTQNNLLQLLSMQYCLSFALTKQQFDQLVVIFGLRISKMFILESLQRTLQYQINNNFYIRKYLIQSKSGELQINEPQISELYNQMSKMIEIAWSEVRNTQEDQQLIDCCKEWLQQGVTFKELVCVNLMLKKLTGWQIQLESMNFYEIELNSLNEETVQYCERIVNTYIEVDNEQQMASQLVELLRLIENLLTITQYQKAERKVIQHLCHVSQRVVSFIEEKQQQLTLLYEYQIERIKKIIEQIF